MVWIPSTKEEQPDPKGTLPEDIMCCPTLILDSRLTCIIFTISVLERKPIKRFQAGLGLTD